jgi:hypothetical protein
MLKSSQKVTYFSGSARRGVIPVDALSSPRDAGAHAAVDEVVLWIGEKAAAAAMSRSTAVAAVARVSVAVAAWAWAA